MIRASAMQLVRACLMFAAQVVNCSECPSVAGETVDQLHAGL